MAALRAAAAGPLPLSVPTTIGSVGDDPVPDTATLLLAHLTGAPADPALIDLGVRARAAMRAAVATGGQHTPMELVYAEIEDILVPSAPFVQDLLARGWTTSQIAGEVVTLTFAGWASLAAVCRSARTLGVGGRDVTASDVTELLRVAPPGWLITRESVEPLRLAGRPAPIAAGTLLVMSPWLLHRDPTSWTRPTEFDPTRSGTLQHPGYLPFGAGSRGCPAERYSRTVLHELLTLQPATRLSTQPVPSLTDDRSTCLVAQEGQSV